MYPNTFYNQLIAEAQADQGQEGSPSYYNNHLYHNPKRLPFVRYNWVRRITPIYDLLQTFSDRPSGYNVLDAGCGIGNESLFFACQRENLKIQGIDVMADRLEMARSRLPRYQQNFQENTTVEFQMADVFSTLQQQQFDLVWTMEAISHIDPAETFIQQVYQNLSPGGYLVISDSHAWNPWMLWRIYQLHKQGVPERHEFQMTSGEIIQMTEGQLFLVSRLSRLLKDAGFEIQMCQLHVYFPPQVAKYPAFFRLCTTLNKILDKVPLLRQIGGIYTIIAKRA